MFSLESQRFFLFNETGLKFWHAIIVMIQFKVSKKLKQNNAFKSVMLYKKQTFLEVNICKLQNF